jgi:hypothetical protein
MAQIAQLAKLGRDELLGMVAELQSDKVKIDLYASCLC